MKLFGKIIEFIESYSLIVIGCWNFIATLCLSLGITFYLFEFKLGSIFILIGFSLIILEIIFMFLNIIYEHLTIEKWKKFIRIPEINFQFDESEVSESEKISNLNIKCDNDINIAFYFNRNCKIENLYVHNKIMFKKKHIHSLCKSCYENLRKN